MKSKIVQSAYELRDGKVIDLKNGRVSPSVTYDSESGEFKSRLTPAGRAKLSRMLKARWATTGNPTTAKQGGRYFSPETREKLAEAARQRWQRERAARSARAKGTVLVNPRDEDRCAICGNAPPTNIVKYVPDDEVTAKVELLRKLMSHDQLVGALLVMLHNLVGQAKGAADGE